MRAGLVRPSGRQIVPFAFERTRFSRHTRFFSLSFFSLPFCYSSCWSEPREKKAWRLGETAWPCVCVSCLAAYLSYLSGVCLAWDQAREKAARLSHHARLSQLASRDTAWDLSGLLQICHLWGTASLGQLFTVHGRISQLGLAPSPLVPSSDDHSRDCGDPCERLGATPGRCTAQLLRTTPLGYRERGRVL